MKSENWIRCAGRMLMIVAGLGWAACATLAPEPDPTRFYTLGPGIGPQANPTPKGGADAVLVGVRVSSVAEYLRRPGIVVRTAGHEITYAGAQRWANPLDGAVGRIVADVLQARLGNAANVTLAPPARTPVPSLVLDLELRACEGRSGDQPAALLDLEWRLFADEGPAAIASGRFSKVQPGWRPGDFQQLAGLLADAIEEFSTGVVPAVKTAVEAEQETPATDSRPLDPR